MQSAKSLRYNLAVPRLPIVVALLLEVKKALLGRPIGIGAEDHLPGECLGAGQWMHVEEERICDPAELNSLARRGRDQRRMALDRDGVSADRRQVVEFPKFGGRGAPQEYSERDCADREFHR